MLIEPNDPLEPLVRFYWVPLLSKAVLVSCMYFVWVHVSTGAARLHSVSCQSAQEVEQVMTEAAVNGIE